MQADRGEGHLVHWRRMAGRQEIVAGEMYRMACFFIQCLGAHSQASPKSVGASPTRQKRPSALPKRWGVGKESSPPAESDVDDR